MTQSTSVDLDLVERTVALIPDQAWTHVRQVIVTALVDCMPGSVVEKLTGSYDDFDKAEHILLCYYELPNNRMELIIDAFKIMGSVNVLELLNAADLNQFIDHDIPVHQSSAVSAMQGERTQDN